MKEYNFSYLDDNTEEEIDLINAFFYLLKKWKSLCVVLILGLVIGMGIAYYKTVISYNKYDPTLAGYEQENAAIEQLNRKYDSYLNQVEKDKSGYLYNLDTEKEYVSGKISLYVSAETADITNLAVKLLDIKKDNTYLAKLSEIIGFNGDSSSLSDCISYDSGIADNTTEKNFATVTFSVDYVTEQECNEILDYIENAVNEAVTQYDKELNNINITTICRDVHPYLNDVEIIINDRISEKQAVVLKEYDDLFKSTQSNYSDNLIRYYNEHFRGIEYHPSKMTFVKYGLIFAIVFDGVLAVFYAMSYLISGCIYTSDEFSRKYHLNIIGNINNAVTYKNIIDKLIISLENKGTDAGCSMEYISKSLNMLPLEKICISTFEDNDFIDDIISKLKTDCNKEIIDGKIHTNRMFLEGATKIGSLILLITLGKTKNSDVKSTLEVCKLHGINPVGAIVVK